MIFNWGPQAGFGHGGRCSVLAAALESLGAGVTALFSRKPPLPSNLANSFENLVNLPDYSPESLAAACSPDRYDLILLDGYNLLENQQRALLKTGAPLVRIDDPPLNFNLADLLLLPSCNATSQIPCLPEGSLFPSRILDAPSHSLARTPAARPGAERNSRMLLATFGSAAPSKILTGLSQGFMDSKLSDNWSLLMVPGPLAEEGWQQRLSPGDHGKTPLFLAEADPFPSRLEPGLFILRQSPFLPELMARAGAVITSAGVSLMEAILSATPVLAGVTAENQRSIYQFLAEQQALIPCCPSGDLRSMTPRQWTDLLNRLAQEDSVALMARTRHRGGELVDGQGPVRAAREILNMISEKTCETKPPAPSLR